jgi:hypothetical protein
MGMTKRHGSDTRGALERGNKAEARFKELAEKNGWTWRDATDAEDMHQHIDCYIEMDGAEFAVDVKAMGTPHKYSMGKVWVELRNVQGKAGWVYGDANFIAFERENGFLLVDRDKLREWLEENVEKEYVNDRRKALMKVYTRNGRKDMVTLVNDYHLIGLANTNGGTLE